MPKLTMYYPQSAGIGNDHLNIIRDPLRKLVAAVASTQESPLHTVEVDFVPISYDDASAVFSQPVAIEIETIGFPFRKAKMTEEKMTALKPVIAGILDQIGLSVDLEKPLIWLKFQDPDGCHV
jgi:hypothetical protein